MIDHGECKSMLSNLSDYVDGELDEEIVQEIKRHLLACRDCTIFVDTLRKTLILYRRNSLGITHIPQDIHIRLYKTLNLGEYINTIFHGCT
jgi:hypothetical protein